MTKQRLFDAIYTYLLGLFLTRFRRCWKRNRGLLMARLASLSLDTPRAEYVIAPSPGSLQSDLIAVNLPQVNLEARPYFKTISSLARNDPVIPLGCITSKATGHLLDFGLSVGTFVPNKVLVLDLNLKSSTFLFRLSYPVFPPNARPSTELIPNQSHTISFFSTVWDSFC